MGYLLPLFLSEDHCSNQRVRTLIFPFDLPGFFCSVRYCSLYLTCRAIKTWVDISPMPIWCTITISIIWGNSYFTWVIWLLYLLEFFWIPSVTNTVFFNLTLNSNAGFKQYHVESALQPSYLHHHNVHGHQTWQGIDLPWAPPTHKVAWPFDHVVFWDHETK